MLPDVLKIDEQKNREKKGRLLRRKLGSPRELLLLLFPSEAPPRSSRPTAPCSACGDLGGNQGCRSAGVVSWEGEQGRLWPSGKTVRRSTLSAGLKGGRERPRGHVREATYSLVGCFPEL